MPSYDKIRELVGPYFPVALPLALIEASVAAEAEMHFAGLVGTGELPPMPCSGFVVGVTVGLEASAAGVLEVAVNGSPNSAYSLTYSGAEASKMFQTPLAFAAGDQITLEIETDSTSKDMHALVLVVLDLIDG